MKHFLNSLKKSLPHNFFLRRRYSLSKSMYAARVYRGLAEGLTFVGVTGTDGKTTTTSFLAQLLHQLGHRVAMMSGDSYFIDGERLPNTSKRSTAGASDVRAFIAKAKQLGCTHIVIEVTAHALTQGRVYGIPFDYAIVTNLAHEHLDYYGTMRNYAKAKAKLFSQVKPSGACVMPYEMPEKKYFTDQVRSQLITFGAGDRQTRSNKARLLESTSDAEGSTFSIDMLGREISDLRLNVAGDYNVRNCLAALAVVMQIDNLCPDSMFTEAVAKIRPVSGRLDALHYGQDFTIWVSFGVTPQAMQKTLEYAQSLKKHASQKVILVFGATGGQHDHKKRPAMGQVAGTYADLSILTDDETYGEPSEKIISEVTKGLPKDASYEVIPDRGEAIAHALSVAKPGDFVIITGLGSFTSRNIGSKEENWSDAKVVAQFFEEKHL